MTEIVWAIGASGFTGRYLIPELKLAGYKVITERVDITSSTAVENTMLKIQPDYIINLAGISFIPDGESTNIYAINTFGPQNILDACLKLKKAPKKIILASSALVYGEQKQEIIDENCIVNPINHYGCSKWAMEQIAKNYQDTLNIIITRPFNYTGIGQDNKFLIPKIVEHFKHKKSVLSLGNIDIWRDFSDVRWVAEAYVQLLKSPNRQKPVNICSGRLTSIREIIASLEELTKHRIKIETNPEFIRQSDIKSQKGNNQQLYSLIPALETPIKLEQTLEWMLD